MNYFTPRPPAHRSLASLQRQWDAKTKSEYYRNVVGLTGSPVRRPEIPDISPKTCQYIIGEPTKRDLRKYGSDRFMCKDPTTTKRDVTRSPYCEHHHWICFVPKPLTDTEK